jgi:integrase
MDARLTGHVEPYRRDGHAVRGWWRLVVELPGGGRKRKVKSVEAGGKKDAEQLLIDWIVELRRELFGEQDPTIAELCEMWSSSRKTAAQKPWRPKTRKFHEDNLRLHILPAFGERRASRLQPADLVLFYAELAEKGLAETSRHHVHATLRAAYNWGMRNELVGRNPCLLMEEPPQQTKGERAIWTEREIARALAAAAGTKGSPQLVYVPIVLGAWAGLRCGEICALRWEHIDLEAGVVNVQAGLSQTEKGELHELAPKTAAGVGAVPLPRQAVEILKGHKARQDAMRIAYRGRWNREGYVICRKDGRPVKPSNLSSSWARFVRVHELPKVRLHDLRHSFATAIFEQEGESALVVVQHLLRHADPTITARTYLHATQQKIDAVRAAQEERIAAAADSLQNGHSDGTRVTSLADARAKKSCKGL